MKKLTALLLVIVCMFGLVACGPKDDSPSEQDSPPPEPETYTFEARYILTDGYYGKRHFPYHVVINSKEELQAYYEENKDEFSLDYSHGLMTFLDACDKYDNAYFERQNLVLLVLEEGSGSFLHEITDVRKRRDENGDSLGWEITINRKIPEVGTDDMAYWHLFLEVREGAVIQRDDAVWITINDQRVY